MLGQHADQSICERIEHFDLVSVTLNVNVVIERRGKEVHRDVSIECSHYILDLSCFLVEFLNLKDIMLLSLKFSKDHIII